eukprot:Tamp_08754.p1 GENE.Tamp_08754~~Tamp_08754.p1  ORF type:complete len:246 (-),score=49.67 Tamp_08754:404-1141(-)
MLRFEYQSFWKWQQKQQQRGQGKVEALWLSAHDLQGVHWRQDGGASKEELQLAWPIEAEGRYVVVAALVQQDMHATPQGAPMHTPDKSAGREIHWRVEVEHTVQRAAYCMSYQECLEHHQQCASSSSADVPPSPPPAGACESETTWRGPHAQGEWVTLDPDDVGFVVGVPARTDSGGSPRQASMSMEAWRCRGPRASPALMFAYAAHLFDACHVPLLVIVLVGGLGLLAKLLFKLLYRWGILYEY